MPRDVFVLVVVWDCGAIGWVIEMDGRLSKIWNVNFDSYTIKWRRIVMKVEW